MFCTGAFGVERRSPPGRAPVQGAKVRTKHELRVASVLKRGPLEFLEMIVVHELARLRESEHNKAFFRLCRHMLPDYDQYELDMRIWLTWLERDPHPPMRPTAAGPRSSAG